MFDLNSKTSRLCGSVRCSLEPLEPRRLLSSQPASGSTLDSLVAVAAVATTHPSVSAVRPANGSTGVARDTFIAADVALVGVGKVVDQNTLAGHVTLTRTSDGASVPGNANTTGGGDAIIFTPSQILDASTNYTFKVSTSVKDTSGNSFTAFTSNFTTGSALPTQSNIRFDQIALPNATGLQYTSVVVGPDHRLYVADLTGYIVRYDILDDGTLGASKTIKTVRDANGGARLITGMAFDPNADSAHPVLWISHGYSSVLGSPDFTGKISKLSGTNLGTYQDVVVNLPRSFKDHLTNQLAWGPDGGLYVTQGSMAAMGAPDSTWGNRAEHLLSAAVLRLGLSKLPSTLPLNVKTADGGGTYNPFSSNAALTIYASGVRNAYDLVWTNDGHLFTATNGSAAGGNTPAGKSPFSGHRIDEAINGPYTGPTVPGETNLPTQDDFLYDIAKGGYYGHPNPLRNEFVLNGGNPTSGKDKAEVTKYPVGTQPDRNYRGYNWDFGKNESPDGMIEYHGDAFGGELDGSLLIAQYSGGDNIIMLTRKGGKITSAQQSVIGFTGFVDPLDLSEDPKTGSIYVAEYGGKRITLLRPDQTPLASDPTVSANQSHMFFNDVRGGAVGPSQTLTIKNLGKQALSITAIGLVGDDPGSFKITQKPTLPLTLQPGTSAKINVAFNPSSGATIGIHTATLRIKSNDPNKGNYDIALRGLATTGLEAANEPSLQRILDLYQIPDNVGDDTPAESRLPTPPVKPNDEIVAQTLAVADSTKPVTVQVLASFVTNANPVATLGFYNAVDETQTSLLNVKKDSNQSVHPDYSGYTRFNPGGDPFGFYINWPSNQQTTFSQDGKNTWDLASPTHGRKVRVYPLKTAGGVVVPRAYVVTAESITDYSDQQDLVFAVRNVKIATDKAPAPPTNLRVLNSAGSVNLAWNASPSDDVVGYNVRRSTTSTKGFFIVNKDLISSTQFLDDTVGQKHYYYRVSAVDGSGNESDVAKISVTVTAATQSATPLTSRDIGNPTPAGATHVLTGGESYDIVAGGADVQGTSDQFRFAYRQISGDFDMKVQVEGLTAVDVWSKAGIMARQTLSANSANVYMLSSPSKYRLTYRGSAGGSTTAVGQGTPTYPNVWVRLKRVGNQFTGYSSTDGLHWTAVSSISLNLDSTLFVGLAATSHNTAKTTTAQFRNLT